ncbi:ABC transporter permease [candidate division KSB1 bacterium]|nr:ABC transporter permease [candidate division KSB1 bacterium]
MFKHYLTIAWRNLRKYKGHALINVIGLAIGIACSILILAFVRHEWSINRNFSNAKQIFRVTRIWQQEPNMVTPPTIAPLMLENYPEIVRANRFTGGWVIVNAGENSFRDRMWITDSTFFVIFDFPFLYGNPQAALNNPNSVVLTERLAQKYFGKTEVLGQTIKFQLWDGQGRRDYKITGVLKNLPYNSVTCLGDDPKTELFIPMVNAGDFYSKEWLTQWGNFSFITYVQLKDVSQAKSVQQKLPALLDKHCPPEIRTNLALKLDSLAELHLTDNNKAVLKVINGLLFLMFLIIMMASINFMNLSTARSVLRAKEIGVRKVLGSVRKQLLWQFMSEAILLSFVALLFGMLLAESCLGEFKAFFGRDLILDYGKNLYTLLALIGLALFVGIVSGSYPAFFLSSLNPVLALKGGVKSRKAQLYIRRFLVIAQFALAIVFAIAAHITSKQLHFILHRDLGFNKESVLVIASVPREWNLAGVKKLEVIKRELMADPEVLATSISFEVPGGEGFREAPLRRTLRWSNGNEERSVPSADCRVDESYIDVFDLQLVEGRFFSQAFFHTDTANSIVLNQAAVKAFGWESAEGKTIKIEDYTFKVIGVVKDFHHASLYNSIKPMTFFYVYAWPYYRLLSVKFRSNNLAETISNIEKTWKRIYPEAPFEYSLMTDLIEVNYKDVIRQIKITGIASLLAISIACLGLLGLASFTAERRIKEIGIRKVLGASVTNILSLLSQEFVKLLLLANLIAWPLAYFFMNKWLQDWAYRIKIDAGMFLLPGALSLVIVLLTVSFQAVKAALANPVNSLRYE